MTPSGMRAGRVRLIFRLPPSLTKDTTPLAFIHWYTPIRDPTNTTSMIRIKASTTVGVLRSSIIPITDIERTCHLIPEFPKNIPTTWTSAKVLDQAQYFYINPYLRHRDFYILRYRLFLQARQEKQRLEAENQLRGETGRKRARGSRRKG
jgi:hypothetical protein